LIIDQVRCSSFINSNPRIITNFPVVVKEMMIFGSTKQDHSRWSYDIIVDIVCNKCWQFKSTRS